uniref:GRF-type domain-containing protein n=1 Tax=Oryza punctata TaxID=4537 RepID=A0A0E0JK26_ORYPU
MVQAAEAERRRWCEQQWLRVDGGVTSWVQGGRVFSVVPDIAMASASSSSCSGRRRRRTSIPLIMCPSCRVKQLVELTANTEANQGRIFFTCPSHEGGSGCDFWYWEEVYIKYMNRKGLIEQNTCAKFLNEAKQKEVQRGTEEFKHDADVKKKSIVEEIKKDADVEQFNLSRMMIWCSF